jgi:hypothetical protein
MKNTTLAAAACAAALAALSTLAPAHDDHDRGRLPRNATFTTLATTPLAIEGLTADSEGNLYTTGRELVADTCPVWKFTGSTRTTVGSIPNPTTARCNPSGIAFDAHGDLYIADGGPAATVWKLTPDPLTPPLASAFATGVPGTNGIAFDGDGNLWTGDGTTGQGRVWKIPRAARASRRLTVASRPFASSRWPMPRASGARTGPCSRALRHRIRNRSSRTASPSLPTAISMSPTPRAARSGKSRSTERAS